MATVSAFIRKRLRLKVNASKSAVARPDTRHFLGYRLAPTPGGSVEILLSERSMTRLRKRIVELVPRSGGRSLEAVIQTVNTYLKGWMGHFGICTSGVRRVAWTSDAHIRRRLRAVVLRHWKRKLTMARQLIRLGAKPNTVWRRLYLGRKSIWALSCDYAVHQGLSNAFFVEQGLFSLRERFQELWTEIHAPSQQLALFGDS